VQRERRRQGGRTRG